MADSTGDRIIAAATAEFSRYGIAGARIERIAKAARTSKERIYAYYRSKEALYSFVVVQELAAIAEATRLDPVDLPGYAGRIHDYFTSHPDRYRLVMWGELELERGQGRPEDPLQKSLRTKIEQLRKAQAAGQLDPEWDAMDILAFVNRIAMSWSAQLESLPEDADRDAFLAARRVAIVAAVQRLFPAKRS